LSPLTLNNPLRHPLLVHLVATADHHAPSTPTPTHSSPLPILTLQPLSRAMEQNWPQGFYNYYPQDSGRPGERAVSPSPANDHEHTHRRAVTQPQHSTFLPPPPPPHMTNSSSGSMSLPPFSQTFYSNHYPPSGPGSGMQMNYPSHIPITAPPAHGYNYPLSSPSAITTLPPGNPSRQPPPHAYTQSPHRIPGGYSSSPGVRPLSPTSPSTHLLGPPGAASSSNSSSSFPARNANLPKGSKRRSNSTSQSEDWDEGSGGGRYMSQMTEDDTETDNQPWGMPQEEYKALNPRDKKQVRNRIGARRFRAKRKDYVSTLEHSLRTRDDEITSLRTTVDSQRQEINALRERLGLPPLPMASTGLGLVVPPGGADGWGDAKKDRDGD
ncbi:hypothetical protein P7C73_g6270, partial [Tremellales sp. Uapishka_1]